MRHPKSILQPGAKQDFLWAVMEGMPVSGELEKHHIFGGARRPMSEENGFWVWLTNANHTGTSAARNRLHIPGVHNERAVDVLLKAMCQWKYQQAHSPQEWMALVGRNYLDEGMPLGADAWPGSLRDRLLEAWLGWLDGQTEEMEEGGFVPDETEGIF